MIIIRLMGVLGNQMFHYALYRRLLEEGKDVYIDLSSNEKNHKYIGYELESVFDINPRFIDNKMLKKVYRTVLGLSMLQRIMIKLKINNEHFLYSL